MTNHRATAANNQPAADGNMNAIVQDAYGAADVLRSGRTARPQIAEDEVLIRVHAAGMDRGTWHMMTGRPYLLRVLGFGFRGPKNSVPGIDVAGTVVAVGSAVSRFAVGDQVYGMSRGRSPSTPPRWRTSWPTSPPTCHSNRRPSCRSRRAPPSRPVDAGRVERGQKVLVMGASGGVGTYAVQLAKSLGAEVTGVSSAGKVDLVRSLGADHVIDYTRMTSPTVRIVTT